MSSEKVGYLKKDLNEMRTAKRVYWRPCWRVVDAQGRDLFLPWSWTKSEAREAAAALGIEIAGEIPA